MFDWHWSCAVFSLTLPRVWGIYHWGVIPGSPKGTGRAVIIVGVNLNKKSYATTFILLLFFFSYRAALSRLEVTMFYYNFCFSQCYQCLALKYICTRLHNCFFFFSLSMLQFQKNWWSFTWNWWERLGSLSQQTDGKNIWSRYNMHVVLFCTAGICLWWAVVSAIPGMNYSEPWALLWPTPMCVPRLRLHKIPA